MNTTARFAVGTVLIVIAAVTLTGCPGLLTGTATEQSATIGAAGGLLQLTSALSGRQGAYVQIPAGALTVNTEITLAASSRRDLTLDGSTPPMSLLDLTPNGLLFQQPIEIGVPYPSGSDPNALSIFWYDTQDGVWVPLADQSLDIAHRRLVGSTNHFTLFALGEKAPVDFAVELYYDGTHVSAGIDVLTPLVDIPIRSESATTYNAQSMFGILEAAPYALRPTFNVTLMQRRADQSDSVLQTVKIQYQVSDLFTDDGAPAEVAVRVDDSPATTRFPIDGDLAQALANVELLFTGQPLLFEFDDVTLTDQASYYAIVSLEYTDGTTYTHDPLVTRSRSADGRAFELNTKSQLMHLADMAAPPDSNADGVIDTFADFGSTSTRAVTAPTFLTGGVTTFSGSLPVFIACGTPDATVIYTTDGTTPTATNGTQAECGVVVTLTQTTTLQAISVKTGRPNSSVTVTTFTKTGP